MPLIKDLIDLPERVQRGDFVLRLNEGVEHADQTLDTYVVTPQLVDCVEEEARAIGKTLDEVRAWAPPAGAKKRGRRRKREG